MRYDASHKQQTRQRVLRAAARAIRSDGAQRVAVAGVMREAGLTHGGFYAHFESKDALVVAAIGQMFDDALAQWQRVNEGRGDAERLAGYIDLYLSAKHRDHPGHGCPMAALASELPRLDADARRAFAEGSRRLQQALSQTLARLGHDDAPALAASVLAELVGAIALARCEPDRKRSNALLASSRHALYRRLSLTSAEKHE
ncbi:TetR/AcrR family transcriptional regulator [Lysobacter niastensis]|uniref:TetR/AcrR family transcriptional regulator n=1 Tax=Lysobacter niastensis TaxID=380629 RepID=A0ABS0B544_9GAMM|nr:TetR/AcrR family transcriptional regulator [Lysobacter niastensis]MBF6023881.1 TetR/AcrR family transcriptional regulator [Lysobacter niastensis]